MRMASISDGDVRALVRAKKIDPAVGLQAFQARKLAFALIAEPVDPLADTRTGGATFSGPYRTALGALCAADVEYQVDRDQGGRGELTFHVAALHAPIGSDDAD